METIETKSTSKNTAEVLKEWTIRETKITKAVLRAIIINNEKNPKASAKANLVFQKKSPTGCWEEWSESKLSSLKAGEGVNYHFSSEELLCFKEALDAIYALGEAGPKYGLQAFSIADAAKVIEVPEGRKIVIEQLINYPEEVWNSIIDTNPDLATRLAMARVQQDRQKSLDEFESNINKELGENFWQKFFEKNEWIFGYGLNYRFLHLFQKQPYYGGKDISNTDGQKGDFLLVSEAFAKFTVTVEIKAPETDIFSTQKDGVKFYRNGVPLISGELAGAISQVQINSYTWDTEGSRTEGNSDLLRAENIYSYQPKSILVIGHTNQLTARDLSKGFSLLRYSLHNPEIITFDELLERARFIVGTSKSSAQP